MEAVEEHNSHCDALHIEPNGVTTELAHPSSQSTEVNLGIIQDANVPDSGLPLSKISGKKKKFCKTTCTAKKLFAKLPTQAAENDGSTPEDFCTPITSIGLLGEHVGNVDGKLLVRCRLCYKQFGDMVLWQQHANSHFDINLLECVGCKRRFVVKTEHNFPKTQQFLCDGCCQQADKPVQKQKPEKRHGPTRYYRCDVCDYKFSLDDLIEHRKLHMQISQDTGLWTYRCLTCHFDVGTRFDLLVRHLCTATFTNDAKHLKSERKFACPNLACCLHFGTDELLVNHLSCSTSGKTSHFCLDCRQHFNDLECAHVLHFNDFIQHNIKGRSSQAVLYHPWCYLCPYCKTSFHNLKDYFVHRPLVYVLPFNQETARLTLSDVPQT